jgi:hypothetical protein
MPASAAARMNARIALLGTTAAGVRSSSLGGEIRFNITLLLLADGTRV